MEDSSIQQPQSSTNSTTSNPTNNTTSRPRRMFFSLSIPMLGRVHMETETIVNDNNTNQNSNNNNDNEDFHSMFPMFMMMNNIAQAALFNTFASNRNGMNSESRGIHLPFGLTPEQLQAFMAGGGNKPKPCASKEVVECLPRIKINNKLDSTCTICQDEFEIGKTAIRLPCSHLFDSECVLEWLKTSNQCPNCRYELLTDDEEYNRNIVLKQAPPKIEENKTINNNNNDNLMTDNNTTTDHSNGNNNYDGCGICSLHNGCELLSGDRSTITLNSCNCTFHKECLNDSQRIINATYLNNTNNNNETIIICPTHRSQSLISIQQLTLNTNNTQNNNDPMVDENTNMNNTSTNTVAIPKEIEAFVEELKRQVSASTKQIGTIDDDDIDTHPNNNINNNEDTIATNPIITEPNSDNKINKRKRSDDANNNSSNSNDNNNVTIEDITDQDNDLY